MRASLPNSMKVTVLGSGTCIPAPQRGNAGYLVESENDIILMDGGSGSLRNIANFGFDYRKIRHVLYTHMHPDHTLDLVALLFALKNDPEITGNHRIEIRAPVGFGSFYEGVLNLFGRWVDSEKYTVTIHEHQPGDAFDLKFVRVSAGPVIHSEQSLAYRIEDKKGSVLVYSGDTGYSEAFADFAAGADCLILEAAIPESESYEKHATPSEAGRMANRANARKTLLTHFYPQAETEDISGIAQQYFSGELVMAEDGVTYSI